MGHGRPGGGRGSPQGREAGLDPRRQRSPWQGPSLADVENLGLQRCCFASVLSLQLRLDSPKCPELPYLAALGDGFCHGPLAPSFSLERSEGKRVEERFRCVVRGAAFMGLVQGVRVQAEAPSACGLWRRGALLGLLGAAHTPRPSQGRKKMPLLLTVEEEMHKVPCSVWDLCWVHFLWPRTTTFPLRRRVSGPREGTELGPRTSSLRARRPVPVLCDARGAAWGAATEGFLHFDSFQEELKPPARSRLPALQMSPGRAAPAPRAAMARVTALPLGDITGACTRFAIFFSPQPGHLWCFSITDFLPSSCACCAQIAPPGSRRRGADGRAWCQPPLLLPLLVFDVVWGRNGLISALQLHTDSFPGARRVSCRRNRSNFSA